MHAADEGFRMPPEWSPQEAVWLSWPVDDPRHWGGSKRELIWGKFAEIAAAISRIPDLDGTAQHFGSESGMNRYRAAAHLIETEILHPYEDAA